jgi:hypothetical protein
VLRVFGTRPISIEASNIEKVEVTHGRFSGRWVRIVHAEPGLPAEIRLSLDIDDPLVVAIGALAAGSMPPPSRQAADDSGSRPEPYPVILRVGSCSGSPSPLP